MLPQWIIEKKRDGHALSAEEIRFFIDGYGRGEIPEYQAAAFAMAVFFRSMNFDEVAVLTDAMMRSGDVLDTSSIPGPKADKHSTGGIGDKVSLVLAPLVACCGVAVPMISGRGLGITGGTLDKLESIPGYRTNLSTAEFLNVVQQNGCSIIGQTRRLAPVDKKLYALRDVTATVPSIPLIAASIMSKKMAEGLDALVLDVKWGRGAFMQHLDEARELARTMVAIGERMGKGMRALLTDMNQPLGRTAGNALEVRETIACLRGEGPADLLEVTLELSAHMLLLTGRANDRAEALTALRRALVSGKALDRFRRMVQAHGGEAAVVDNPGLLPSATIQAGYPAPRAGFVLRADADRIGRACVVLGAGRRRVEDRVDPAVGVSHIVKVGERVERGQNLLVLHASDPQRRDEAQALLEGAFEIGDTPPSPAPLITEAV